MRPGSAILLSIVFAISCAAGATADEPAPEKPQGKPACTAAIVGEQWPEEAADPVFAAALAPYGYPMRCTHTASGYVWQSLRARSEQPKKGDKPVQHNPGSTSRPVAKN